MHYPAHNWLGVLFASSLVFGLACTSGSSALTKDVSGNGGGGGNGPSSSGGAGATASTGSGGAGTSSGAGGSTEFPIGVTVHLERIGAPKSVVSFGLPVARGKVADASKVRVSANGAAIAASVKAILPELDKDGVTVGARSLLIQFPASVMTGDTLDVDVAWEGAEAGSASVVPYEEVSQPSPSVVKTAVRSIVNEGGVNKLVEISTEDRTLFTGREPWVLATYPAGYLADTGILGAQVSAEAANAPSVAGLAFLSKALGDFGRSAMYTEPYALNPAADSVPDPVTEYEGWLYDRCATFLTAFAHTGDSAFLRHAYRSCSYYGSKIDAAGFFTGKPEQDTKYSHLRGLYAYYAMTGDEAARTSGVAVADLWYNDKLFVGPYREGHVRGKDKLWTERLLGTSMEGLYYGHLLTGDKKYLTGFSELLTTAYRHITGDQATLAEINPGFSFPPQNCFVHSAEQHAEGDASEPWCSGWMVDLMLDPMIEYQRQTGDERVSEILVRLTRFLRDTGSSYFRGDPFDDTFLEPQICYDATDEDPRILMPLYGAGLNASMSRDNASEWSDFEHCTDATALVAAGIRALKLQGKFDGGGQIGPFSTEGESFVQLLHEFAACADYAFKGWVRTKRDPANWTSAELASGVANPAQFIASNKIGYPSHPTSPQRKVSWWFNVSMLDFGLLKEANVDVETLKPGAIKPCP